MRCLNLKLTYECTNHCPFCFSSYLRESKISLDGLKNAVEEGYRNGCRELVLSGGEPTLYPNYVTTIVELAESLGYCEYIVQTNGSGLADNREFLSFLDKVAQTKKVCVSFSVHGHDALLHDSICHTNGAFEKLSSALDNIKQTHCKVYTNTVVSRLNIVHLKKIAQWILPYNPSIMQFSMMRLAVPNELCTSLYEMSQTIKELATIVDRSILKTEGIPFCMMYGLESCVGESFWPNKLDIYNAENDYRSDFTQLGVGMRSKGAQCKDCIMDEICMGVWSEHVNEFRDLNLHAIN